MRIYALISLLFLAVMGTTSVISVHGGPVSSPFQIDSSLSYIVNIDDSSASKHSAYVYMVLPTTGGYSTTLTFHTYHGRYPIPILSLNATNERGERLAVEYSEYGGRYWTIVSRYAKQVSVEYFVVFNVTRGAAENLGYLGRNFGMSMAEWTFLVPHGLSVRNVRVKFNLPTGWRSYTPWDILEPETYICDSLESFIMSVYGLGGFDLFGRKIGDTDVSIAVYNDWPRETKERIAETSFKIFEYQTKLFGKSVMDRYLAIFSPVADDEAQIWGGEYSQSQGLSVRTPLNQIRLVNAMQWFSHQIFHRWNAWIPGGMSRKSDEAMWLSEGTNVYYESKILLDLRLEVDYSILRNLYSEYLNRYLGTKYDISVIEAPKYYAPELTAKDWEEINFLIYRKGALISLLLDIEIRRATSGEKTFDHLLSHMYSLYGGRRGSYSNEDLIRVLGSLTGRDFTDFFKRYVYGTERLPLDQHFTEIGQLRISGVARVGSAVSVSSRLVDFRKQPLPNQDVSYYLGSIYVGRATTNASGVSHATFSGNLTGVHDVVAIFLGTKEYSLLQSGPVASLEIVPEGELAYDSGTFGGSWSVDSRRGTAVLFTPPSSLWIVEKVKVYAKRVGEKEFFVEIWDSKMQKPSRSSPLRYSQFFPDDKFAWIEISIQPVRVDGDFYICLFTGSTPQTGVQVGFSPVESHGSRSYLVRDTNAIAEWTVTPPRESVEWMLRAIGTPETTITQTRTATSLGQWSWIEGAWFYLLTAALIGIALIALRRMHRKE